MNSPLAAFVSSLLLENPENSISHDHPGRRTTYVQSGGVKSLPEFKRSKEQVVVSDMALRHFPDEFSPKKRVWVCVCVTDEGKGF